MAEVWRAPPRAAWLDEAGQDAFTLETYDATRRRLSLSRGRLLITTTLYNFGWLKTQIYDKAKAGDPDIVLIQFPSILNPQFPRAEYDERQASMPSWKFRMAYTGEFERPAGMVYDCLDEQGHVVPAFTVPAAWPRYLGLDFGGINTAAVYLAAELAQRASGEWDEENPTGRFFVYGEYHAGNRTGAEHAGHLLRGEPSTPICVGGAKSEGQWRLEFRSGGLGVREPDQGSVEVGISRVYAAFKTGKLLVMDSCQELLDELRSYNRKLDENGEPTEEIEDKAAFHRLDALRYIVSWLFRTNKPAVR